MDVYVHFTFFWRSGTNIEFARRRVQMYFLADQHASPWSWFPFDIDSQEVREHF